MRYGFIIAILFTSKLFTPLCHAQEKPPETNGIYVLSEYGSVVTIIETEKVLKELVVKIVENGGGIVVIDNKVCKDFIPSNTYLQNLDHEKWINPDAKDSYKGSDKEYPTITLIDIRRGYCEAYVPQYGGRSSLSTYGNWFAGIGFRRTVSLKPTSMDPGGSYANIDLNESFIHGTVNFRLPTMYSINPGKDVKIYFPHVVGLFEGARLVSPRKDGKGEIITVKKILWDAEKRKNYILADVEREYPAGAMFDNKSNLPGISMMVNDNADNQTAGHIFVHSEKNGLGDDFLFNGMLSYSSDISNATGDEGGVVYNAEVRQNLEAFNSRVTGIDRDTNTLYFEPARKTVCFSLSMSRPLINMNQDKWITGGKIVVVASERILHDPINKIGTTYKGKQYPFISAATDMPWERGGLIEGSEDTPWDESIIGRYLAINETSEYILGKNDFTTGYHYGPRNTPVYRWYQIVSLIKNPDNTKIIKIRRVFRNSAASGGPVLINSENYSWDGHVKPLKYIIAPGADVCDITNAWQDARNNYKKESTINPDSKLNSLKIIPNGDAKTKYDFEKGDPVIQAIGSEPWIPRAIRIRMFNHFPSEVQNGAIEVFSYNTIAATYGLLFNGGVGSKEQILRRKDQRPSYLNGVLFHHTSSVGAGIHFAGYVKDAAILMSQRQNNPQPIVWKYNNSRNLASVVTNPANGILELKSTSVSLENTGLLKTKGISATEKSAQNLRGINITVPQGTTQLQVTYPDAEPDETYSLTVQANWLTLDRVVSKTASGFSIEFSTPAPKDATIDWQLLR